MFSIKNRKLSGPTLPRPAHTPGFELVFFVVNCLKHPTDLRPRAGRERELQSTFDIYTTLKKKLSGLSYHNVDLCLPAAAIVANLLFRNTSERRKKRSARKLLWREPKLTNANALSGQVISWNLERADHKKNVHELHTHLSSADEKWTLVHIADITKDYRKAVRPKHLWRALLMTFSIQAERQHFIFVWAALVYTMKYLDALERKGIPSSITKLVSYNSSNIPECFLVAACNSHAVPTFSVQHSLYQDYYATPPLDVINYENVVAKSLLVWSEFCRGQIIAFYERNGRTPNFEMPVTGYLNFSPRRGSLKQPNAEPKTILCLLPRDEIDSSILLMKILLDMDEQHQILVRFHPVASRDKILPAPLPANFAIDQEPLLSTTLSKRDISVAVGFNTTSLFDALLFDIPCALFSAPDGTYHINNFPCFETREELERFIKTPRLTRDIADYVLGAHISRYSEILNSCNTPV